METTDKPRAGRALAANFDGGWALLPLLSAAGGAWAFNRSLWTEDPATLAVVLALVAGGWQPLWRALATTDWATPLGLWPGWQEQAAVLRLPYVQPGTPGARLSRRLAFAAAWWQDVGRAHLGPTLRQAAGALTVSLLLGLALGRLSLMMTFVLLAVAELAALWHEGSGRAGPLWTSLSLVAAPWYFGASLGTPTDAILPLLSAAVLALMVGLYALPKGWALVGPIIGAAFLAWQGHAASVGWLLLLAVPGLTVLTTKPETDVYRRMIGPWVLGMVALMARTL